MKIVRLFEVHCERDSIQQWFQLVNSTGQSVFSLAVCAFPTVPEYQVWLQFLAEIYECSPSQAALFPYDQMAEPPKYFTISRAACDLSFRPIPTAIPFRCTDPCEAGTEYAQRYIDYGKEPICPIAVAASLPDPALLLWLLDQVEVDANWMSDGKPLWLRLLQLQVPTQAWSKLSGVVFCCRHDRGSSSSCYLMELSTTNEDYYYPIVWLWESLKYSEASCPLSLHLKALQTAYPDNYTDHYMSLLERFYGTSNYYSQHIRTAETDQTVLGAVSPVLDCTAASYRRFLYKRVDETIRKGEVEALKQLIKLPGALDFVLRPYECAFSLGICSELALADLTNNYRENINEDFITNSYLYFVLSSNFCSAELLSTLLDLGCPLLNPSLPAEMNNFHLFHAFSKQERRYYQRKIPEMTISHRECCLHLLSQRMFAAAAATPALYRELGIGVDITTDKAACSRVRSQWPQETSTGKWRAPTWTVFREVLWHPGKPLFGKCYGFERGKEGFWLSKTAELVLRLSALGDLADLKELISQFSYFSEQTFAPTPSLSLPDISEATVLQAASLEGLHIHLAQLLMQPGLIQLPGGLAKPVEYAQCLGEVMVRFGVLRGAGKIESRKVENTLRSVLGVAELMAKGKAEFAGEMVTLKCLFRSYFAFLRSTKTTLMHYLAKREDLSELLEASLSGFNARLGHYIDSKGRCCLGIAAYYGNIQGIDVLLGLNWRFPPFGEGLSPLLLCLEGLRYSYKAKRRPMKVTEALDSELDRRFQGFKLLHSRLPAQTEVLDTADDSGYDSSFSVEKRYMRGSPESLYGYPLIVAAAHYKPEQVKEMISMGLSPCAVHRYSLQVPRKAGKQIVKVAKEMLTCALKQSLLRCRPDIASLLMSEIALKYPKCVLHQA